jgi:hypothetical protein
MFLLGAYRQLYIRIMHASIAPREASRKQSRAGATGAGSFQRAGRRIAFVVA